MTRFTKRSIVTALLAVFVCALSVVGFSFKAQTSAKAADLGVVQPSTATTLWIASDNKRVIFKMPSSVPATGASYALQSGGTITLVRGANTWTRTAVDGFSISTHEGHGYIELWKFGHDDSTHNIGGTFILTTGDKVIMNGTFSDGTNSFRFEEVTIVVNSTTTGDMYVEEPAVEVGRAMTETEHTWMNRHKYVLFKLAQSLPVGIYKPMSINNITVIRDGVTHKPSSNNLKVEVQSDKIFVDQTGYFESIRTTWDDVFKDGDIVIIQGRFEGPESVINIQKTSILVESTTLQTAMPLVTWLDADGKEDKQEEVKYNSVLTKPADPVKEQEGYEYVFTGWYNGESEWDFATPVTSDITLTPKFDSCINAGVGRDYDASTGNSGWAQSATAVLFSMDANLIPEWTALTTVDASAIRLIRGGSEICGNVGQETLTKRNANTYVVTVQAWTFPSISGVQDGDVIVLDGAFTKRDDPTDIYKIGQTIINISVDASGNVTARVTNSLITVTFMHENAVYATQDVVEGAKLVAPTAPTKDADVEYTYEFDGWYNGDEKWNFDSDTVSESLTLVAVFNAKEKEIINAGYGYNESVKSSSTGFFFKMQANSVPYSDAWNVRYKPVTQDAIKKIRDGVTTNVGNLDAETIVKYGVNSYYVEAWAVGNWQDGDIFVFDGVFKNEANGTLFKITATYVKVIDNGDGTHTDVVLNPTVTFLDANGEQISKQTIAYNSLISEPASVPSKAEDDENTYVFKGWYNGEDKWNFSVDIPNGDVTLTPKYEAISKYAVYKVTNVVTATDKDGQGFYLYADVNDAPFDKEWSLRYKPTSVDAIVKISADGTRTNVGNLGAETIVKYGDGNYYVEAWAIGGYEHGATYVLNGQFKNSANRAIIEFDNVRVKLSITDGSVSAGVLREQFSMVTGAAVRTTGSAGIRFEAEIGFTYDEDAKYYMMIVPCDYLQAFGISQDYGKDINYYTALIEALNNAGKGNIEIATMECLPFVYTAEEIAKNGRNAGSYYIRGSLVNIQDKNVNRKFFGVAYSVKNGVYTYASFVDGENIRSIAYVASMAKQNGESDENGAIDKYLKLAFGTSGDYADVVHALNKTSIVGYPVSERLTLSNIPESSNLGVTWASDNPSAVAVDQNGNVIGMASGSAIITATFLDKTYSCTVTNMAGAKVNLTKAGNVISWDYLAEIETYLVEVYDENGFIINTKTVKNNCVDLTKLSLATNNKYSVSVKAIIDGVHGVASKCSFVYEDVQTVYTDALESEDSSIGVWSGSYHFNDHNRVKELADAGVDVIIGSNPVWHESIEAWISVLDKAYEYGVSFIVDPREHEGDGYKAWDGVLPSYATHPAVKGFMAYDEPVHIGDYGDSQVFSKIASLQNTFNAQRSAIGREDLIFFVNILGSSGIAGNSGENKYNYETGYVDEYLSAVDVEVLAMDSYALLKNGTTPNIRKSYYYSFDVLSKKAKAGNMPLWYTLLSSGHTAGDEGNFVYTEPTEQELRWQMAVGITFGAKNLTHYTYTSHEANYTTMYDYSTNELTALYDRVKKVNNEYKVWDNIYNSFEWQGYSALDFGETSDTIFVYKSNALMDNTSNSVAVNAIGGLSSVEITGSASTSSTNNAKDVLVGMFKDASGNPAFMVTNAASAVNDYSASKKYYANLKYTMEDVGLTLTFDSGYVGAIVIDNGVKTYHTLSDNKLNIDVEAWEGVFVIPVKAQSALSFEGGQITVDNGVIAWPKANNAEVYEVVISRGENVIFETIVKANSLDLGYRIYGDYTVKVTARNDGRYTSAQISQSISDR